MSLDPRCCFRRARRPRGLPLERRLRVNPDRHSPLSRCVAGPGGLSGADPVGVERMTIAIKCCVPGCGESGMHGLPQIGERLCHQHFFLASAQSRGLLQSAARRLARLQRSWDDDSVFEEITVRGRYLAFCALLQTAHDHVDRAWDRVSSEVPGAADDLHPRSPGIAPSSGVPDPRLDPRPWTTERMRRVLPAR